MEAPRPLPPVAAVPASSIQLRPGMVFWVSALVEFRRAPKPWATSIYAFLASGFENNLTFSSGFADVRRLADTTSEGRNSGVSKASSCWSIFVYACLPLVPSCVLAVKCRLPALAVGRVLSLDDGPLPGVSQAPVQRPSRPHCVLLAQAALRHFRRTDS